MGRFKGSKVDLLVSLDLDETLIHTGACHGGDGWWEHFHDEHADPWHFINIRPGATHLIRTLNSLGVGVGVYTAATMLYADAVLDGLWPQDVPPPMFVLDRKRCTRRIDHEALGHYGRPDPYFEKRVRKIVRRHRDLGRLLHVDDRPGIVKEYGNVVPVAPFHGAPDDRHLFPLTDMLGMIAKSPGVDVRRVNTVDWARVGFDTMKRRLQRGHGPTMD